MMKSSLSIFLSFLFLSFSLIAEDSSPQEVKETILVNKDLNDNSLSKEYEPDDHETLTQNFESMFFKTIIALVVLVTALIVLTKVVKRMSGTRIRNVNGQKTIKVLEKRAISPKSALYLVEIAGKQIVIAESQLEVRAISEFSWDKTKENQATNS